MKHAMWIVPFQNDLVLTTHLDNMWIRWWHVQGEPIFVWIFWPDLPAIREKEKRKRVLQFQLINQQIIVKAIGKKRNTWCFSFHLGKKLLPKRLNKWSLISSFVTSKHFELTAAYNQYLWKQKRKHECITALQYLFNIAVYLQMLALLKVEWLYDQSRKNIRKYSRKTAQVEHLICLCKNTWQHKNLVECVVIWCVSKRTSPHNRVVC